MKTSMKLLAALVLGVLVTLSACKKKDSEPTPLTLKTITAGSTDLNGATAPTGVDPDAAIVATFSTNVDPATATASNISLTRDYDQTDVPITIATSGSTVTVTPNDPLTAGALFKLEVTNGLKSTDGLAITGFNRSFTTAGTFTPDGQVSHWTFEDNANDVVGDNDPVGASGVVDITYVAGRNAGAGKAAVFNGTTSIIEIPDGSEMLNPEFTIAFWMNLDSAAMKANGVDQKGHFVMGVGAFNGVQFEIEDHERWVKWAQMYKRTNAGVTDTSGLDFFYDGKATIHGTNRDTSVVVSKAQTSAQIQGNFGAATWNHIVYTFSAATKVTSMYWNGILVFQADYNFFQQIKDANLKKFYGVTGMALKDPGVDPGQADFYDDTWAFGFWESRASTFPSWGQDGYQYNSVDAAHYKGKLDDVRLYHRALTATEVTLMYNSEK